MQFHFQEILEEENMLSNFIPSSRWWPQMSACNVNVICGKYILLINEKSFSFQNELQS